MIANLQLDQLLLASGAELLGGMIQGCSGIGLNLVAVPILMLIDRSYVPGPTLCTAVLLTGAVLRRDWQPTVWAKSRAPLAGRIPGTFGGAAVLLFVSAPVLELIASCAIVLGVLTSALGRLRLSLNARNGFGAGVVAAFFATTASVGGPPLAIYFRWEKGRELRAIIALNGLLGSLLSLTILGIIGHFGWDDVVLFLTLVPGMLIGFAISSLVGPRIDDRQVRRLALSVALLSAIVLGARGGDRCHPIGAYIRDLASTIITQCAHYPEGSANVTDDMFRGKFAADGSFQGNWNDSGVNARWAIGPSRMCHPASVTGLARAKSKIDAFSNLHAFTFVSDEQGPGEVVAVKDNVDVQGQPTSGGSRWLPATPASADADVVAAARRHGCVFVGKTNLHEWALGPTSLNSTFGDVLNPHDPTRVAGGSSGGSAVAAAIGACDWAIGTDTGGSIRIPASFCGVVGFKPTYGVLSTRGVIPVSQSLDTVGALARSVAAAGRGVEFMSNLSLGIDAARGIDFEGLRLGFPCGWVNGLDPTTQEAWEAIAPVATEVPFPGLGELHEVRRIIAQAEAYANHAVVLRGKAVKYDREVSDFLETGRNIRAANYLHALDKRRILADQADDALTGLDALVLPAVPEVAVAVNKAVSARSRITRFTRPFNLTGNPVIVVPVPNVGLPVGIQLVGRRGRDAELVHVAMCIERAWARETPPFAPRPCTDTKFG